MSLFKLTPSYWWKKLHHGEVLYTTIELPSGRLYKREFRVPCGYGLLVFNIGPAASNLPYAFDVYDDGYVYSDNGGLCLLYPSYRAHQNDTQPTILNNIDINDKPNLLENTTWHASQNATLEV